MTKQQFISKLRKKLSTLSKKDAEERLAFYSEMIDDRIEGGLSEEDAIAEIGSADEVAYEITKELNASRTTQNKNEKKRMSAWQISLLILGSPLWISLLIAAFAVIFAAYVVLWSLVIVIYALELPFMIFSFISKYLFIACKWATKSSVYLTKQGFALIKKFFKGGDTI